VGLGVLLPICLFASPALADPTAARQKYERGLEELKAGNLAQARESFEEAYRLSPHYLVLYNLGRASLDLGDLEAARAYFERYLEEGGGRITPTERRRIEALLPATRPKSAKGSDDPLAVPVAPPTATSSRPVTALPVPEPARVPSPSVPSSPLTAPASRENPGIGESPEFEARLARERQTTAALALGVTGVVLGAAGALVLAWNQGRSADYERAQRSLGPPPPPGVRSQEELDREIAIARATE
jgi:tetratricopeptide (TPR) repeat protein